MKPASSAKRAKRAKAAAKSAKNSRYSRSSKSLSAGKSKSTGKSGPASKARGVAGGNASGGARAGRLQGASEAGLMESSAAGVGAIDHARPTMGRQEIQAVTQLLRTGTIEPGAEVRQLEEEFCRFLGLPTAHALAVCNSSAAFYLALRVLDAQGKTVAIPVYASSASIEAARLAGARELLVDVASGRVHIDAGSATTSGAQLAVVSHSFGFPAKTSLEGLKGLTVIEDCSDALGAKIGDSYVGIQGDLAVYSFAATGLITAGGQGGMLVSRNRDLIDRARHYVHSSTEPEGREHFDFGMGEIQAAIARVQLAKLPNFLARREEIFSHYQEAGFDLIDTDEPGLSPVRFRAVMRVHSPQKIIDFLGQGMIKTVVPFAGEVLAAGEGKFPQAAELCASTVSIPIYPHLTNEEVGEIIEQIEIALEQCAQ